MARMITAPGIIRHIDKYTNTMRKLQFSIAVGDWTESSGVYTAEWLNDYITTSSFEIATYDHTLRDNGKGDIELEKKSGGGGLVFTTNALPTGTITGIVYVFDTQDGKLPVLLEDGTVEIEQGGTGATTAAGALANFGLDNAEHAQEALGFGDAVQMGVANDLSTSVAGYLLDARQGKALASHIVAKDLGSNTLSELKTKLIQAAGESGASTIFNVKFYCTEAPFNTSYWYYGTIAVAGGQNYFTGTVYTLNGLDMTISNNNGTWKFSSLNDQIANIDTRKSTILTNANVTSDTSILSLDNGSYQVASATAVTPYLPYSYGTLIVMGTSNNYGIYIFLSTVGGMYVRHRKNSSEWSYTWKQVTLT